MSRLGEWLLERINRIFPPLKIHRELDIAKRDMDANFQWAYNEMTRIAPCFEPYWDLSGQQILDIGPGLGGKSPYFFEKAGVRSLTGVDIDMASLKLARQHSSKLAFDSPQTGLIRFLAADAALLPFPNDCFDAIVSINTFEHIERVEEAVHETYRVTKKGGLVFLHLPPYYGPWGPHLELWIRIPWPHLFFSERTMMRVAAREDTRIGLVENLIQEGQKIEWEKYGEQIPGVNRVTYRQFRRYIEKAGFKIVQLKLLPVGYQYLKDRIGMWRLILNLLKFAVNIPGLQEIIVTKMVFVLRKER